MTPAALPRHRAAHLERALRDGSSWPVVVRDTTGARWLVKLRGAAQGTAPLVAEVIVAELAAALDLPVPARAVVTLAGVLPTDDPHQELADLQPQPHDRHRSWLTERSRCQSALVGSCAASPSLVAVRRSSSVP